MAKRMDAAACARRHYRKYEREPARPRLETRDGSTLPLDGSWIGTLAELGRPEDNRETGAELLARRQGRRDRYARALREMRRGIAVSVPLRTGIDVSKRNELIRALMLGNRANVPAKPTYAGLRAEAFAAWEYATASFGPIILDDGYACCGMEDARGEAQDYARWEALALASAALLVRRLGPPPPCFEPINRQELPARGV